MKTKLTHKAAVRNLSNFQYFLWYPLFFITAAHLFGIDSIRFVRIVVGIASHSDFKHFISSCLFLRRRVPILRFKMLKRFSMGLRSGDKFCKEVLYSFTTSYWVLQLSQLLKRLKIARYFRFLKSNVVFKIGLTIATGRRWISLQVHKFYSS